MVKDLPTIIVTESIRRLVKQAREEIDSGEIEYEVIDPVQRFVDPEDMRDLAALNVAMSRIIKSVDLN